MLTFPSARSVICCNGRLALYTVVVTHHIGRPNSKTINQKDRMIHRRVRTFEASSGGGSHLVLRASATFFGSRSRLSRVSDATAACDIALSLFRVPYRGYLLNFGQS